MFNNKAKAILIAVITLTALSLAAGTAWAVPPIPSDYSGTVYVGGVQAVDGLVVTASMTGWNSSAGAVTYASGQYQMLGIDPPESVSGTINFYVNGVQADEISTFVAGESFTLNLHVTALPTPTPTPMPTPTPTPVPTPTPTPITSNASTSIGPSGGTVNTSDGTITITFPAGAFNTFTNVSIQGGNCQYGATADFKVGGTCFNITPDGVLGANASICVNLSTSDLSIALSQKSDPTFGYWFNGSWVESSNVTLNSTVLCGQTNHLCHWAVLIPTVNGTSGPTSTPSASPTATPSGSQTPAATSTATATPSPSQTPSEEEGGGTNWGLVGGIAGGMALLAAAFIAMNRRGHGGKGKGEKKSKPKQRADNSKKDEPW